ncbi:ribonuclease H-like domain-containing protein [Tanacetum coccineum]
MTQLGTMGPTPLSGQATNLPHAFNTETLQDLASGAWNIDTDVISHLNSSITSLSDVFNTCIYPSVSVGDGHTIPVTNTGIVFVRCDGTGDLYPVTTPSPIPHAFLVSQHTWHQRLGHLGSEVLRRLVSSNFISCNKEKPLVFCHACQLGKHVRLPFCDHGGEFDNHALRKLFADNDIKFRFSCAKTSQQNGKSERMVRTINNLIHGTLSRYKARLMANGSTQLEGVDVDKTFSPVVKPSTIRIVLSLAASRHWPIHQLDVKNAFLHGDLSETVYMHQPLGFQDSVQPDYHSRYFVTPDYCFLASGVSMTDHGSLNYFLGIFVTRDSSGLFLSQRKYVIEILKRAHMNTCNPCRTPVDTDSKLSDDGDPVSDPTLYRNLTGSLQYLTFTPLIFLMRYSSAEVEYRGVANAVAETCWLCNLPHELHTPLSSATLVYCYNVRVLHVPSRYQFADIFAKRLPSALFEEFRSSLSARCPPAPTAGEC